MTRLDTYLELSVEIDFDVDPGQELIMYPNDRAQEGIPPSIEINSVQYRGVEILLNEEQSESIRQECWDYLEGMEEAAQENAAELMYDERKQEW